MTNPSDGGDRRLYQIAGASASLAFGVMVATLFAVKLTPSGLIFRVTPAAVVSFLIAAPFAWFYWRMVAGMATGDAPERRRRKFIVFSIGLLLVGFCAFLYPLKFIPAEKRKDVFIGLALALSCITGVGFVMLKVKRFLDADLKASEDENNQS